MLAYSTQMRLSIIHPDTPDSKTSQISALFAYHVQMSNQDVSWGSPASSRPGVEYVLHKFF